MTFETARSPAVISCLSKYPLFLAAIMITAGACAPGAPPIDAGIDATRTDANDEPSDSGIDAPAEPLDADMDATILIEDGGTDAAVLADAGIDASAADASVADAYVPPDAHSGPIYSTRHACAETPMCADGGVGTAWFFDGAFRCCAPCVPGEENAVQCRNHPGSGEAWFASDSGHGCDYRSTMDGWINTQFVGGVAECGLDPADYTCDFDDLHRAVCPDPDPAVWTGCTNCFSGFCYRECNPETGLYGTCRTDADCQDPTRPRYSIDTPDCRMSPTPGPLTCASIYPPLGTGYACGNAGTFGGGCTATDRYGLFHVGPGGTRTFVCCAPCNSASGGLAGVTCTTRPGTGEGWYNSGRNSAGVPISCDWNTSAQGLIASADCRTDI